MTDYSNILDSIIGDGIDIPALRAKGVSDQGIDFAGVYCYHTGKLIGSFNGEELDFAVEEEISDSLDDLLDSLIIRCLASMRPSPALNKPDRITIRNLVAKRPIDALAYLLNRLYHPLPLVRDLDDSLAALRGRIEMHNWCSTLPEKTVSELTHWLLEADAKFNLALHGAKIVQITRESLIDKPAEFINAILKFLCKPTLPDSQGNRLASSAHLQSWFDNSEFEHKKEVLKRPLRDSFRGTKSASAKPVSEKIRKMNERLAGVAGLLDEVIAASQPSSTRTVARPKVMTAGMLFKRKES